MNTGEESLHVRELLINHWWAKGGFTIGILGIMNPGGRIHNHEFRGGGSQLTFWMHPENIKCELLPPGFTIHAHPGRIMWPHYLHTKHGIVTSVVKYF